MLPIGRGAPNLPIGVFCTTGKLGEFCCVTRFLLSEITCGPKRAVLGLVR